MNGVAELKVKESNRLNAIAEELKKCNIEVKIDSDSLEIIGGYEQPQELVEIKTYMDHRIAMSFLIMGLKIKNGLKIDDYSMINTSFPGFISLFNKLGIEFKN